jgi:hypothetical protein
MDVAASADFVIDHDILNSLDGKQIPTFKLKS